MYAIHVIKSCGSLNSHVITANIFDTGCYLNINKTNHFTNGHLFSDVFP